jgi:hypothetical protein
VVPVIFGVTDGFTPQVRYPPTQVGCRYPGAAWVGKKDLPRRRRFLLVVLRESSSANKPGVLINAAPRPSVCRKLRRESACARVSFGVVIIMAKDLNQATLIEHEHHGCWKAGEYCDNSQ